MLEINKSNTFLVNLPARQDRFASAHKQLYHYKIEYTLWPAIKNENGRLGLIQTMKAIFDRAIKSNLQCVNVFEDDILFCRNPNHYLPLCLKELPDNFDIFYFGPNLAKPPTRFSDNLLKTKAAYSTHACIYSRTAIQLIMQQIDKASVYDMFLVEKIQRLGNCYCCDKMIASQISDYSDIEKKIVNYSRFLETRFLKQTRNL